MKIMKYAERVSERGIKEFDKLTEEVEGLMDMREAGNGCGTDDGRGGD